MSNSPENAVVRSDNHPIDSTAPRQVEWPRLILAAVVCAIVCAVAVVYEAWR